MGQLPTNTDTMDSFDNFMGESVRNRIKNIADGNYASKDDVKETYSRYSAVELAITLIATPTWSWKSDVLVGVHKNLGSSQCESLDEAKREIEQHLDEEASAASTQQLLLKRLNDNPEGRFTTFGANTDNAEVLFNAHDTLHVFERCKNCNGSGDIACTNFSCNGGHITCNHCNGTGSPKCWKCYGHKILHDNVSVPDGQGGFVTRYMQIQCTECDYRGRSGPCHYCSCTGKLTCPTCSGTTRIRCNPCKGTGWFTYYYHGTIKAKVSVITNILGFEPDNLKSNLAMCPVRDIPTLLATKSKFTVGPAGSRVNLTANCVIPFRTSRFEIKGNKFYVDAISPSSIIYQMPQFLDPLLGPVVDKVGTKGAARSSVIHLIKESRVGSSVVAHISGATADPKGKKKAVQEVVDLFHKAVSKEVVEKLHNSADQAYHGIGRGKVRETWIYGIIPVIALSGLEDIYGVGEHAVSFMGTITASEFSGWICALLPVVGMAVIAAHRGHASVKTVLEEAKRKPRQGMWPWIAVGVAIVLRLAIDPTVAVVLHNNGVSVPVPQASAAQGGLLAPYLPKDVLPGSDEPEVNSTHNPSHSSAGAHHTGIVLFGKLHS